jgi:RimJ/RimL family protein N-acetyltransferase
MKDPEVVRFLADPSRVYSLEDLKEYVRQMNESTQDHLFGIFLNGEERHVGNIKIGSVQVRHGFGDVGIVIGDRSLWGRGLATKAISLVRKYAFEVLGLQKLCAGVVVGNEGSLKAFLKAGFCDIGRYHQHWLIEGIRRDQYILECLRESGKELVGE